MAINIDWGILGRPADIGQAFQAGYQGARAQRREQMTQDALASYGANPGGPVPQQLWALDPRAASLASSNSREVQETQRAARARGNYATYLQQNTQNALAGMSGGVLNPQGSPTNEVGDIVVTAPDAQPQQPLVTIADIAADDTRLAEQLTAHMGSISKQKREEFADQFGIAAAVAASAKRLPEAERRAFLDANRSILKAYDWSDDAIDGADLSDRGLDGLIAIGIGADKYLANARSERSEERQEYYRARSDARASASEGRAQRAERRAQTRFNERDLDRAAMAGGLVSSDTSDLDY